MKKEKRRKLTINLHTRPLNFALTKVVFWWLNWMFFFGFYFYARTHTHDRSNQKLIYFFADINFTCCVATFFFACLIVSLSLMLQNHELVCQRARTLQHVVLIDHIYQIDTLNGSCEGKISLHASWSISLSFFFICALLLEAIYGISWSNSNNKKKPLAR